MNVKERYKTLLIEIITMHLPDTKIYLYGSRARGTHREGSDIDLAVDAGKKVEWSVLSRICEDIEDTTIPLFVDVVDIHCVGKDFLDEIQREWVVWR